MSERIEKIADEILSVVNKKRTSGKTPEKDVWVATYLPNRQEIAVIFGDREVSNSYVQHRFKKDDRASVISTLEKLYGSEPRNHNEESLEEDTVYDHSWYEVEDGDYPKRTKEGVEIKETTCAGSVACVGKRIGKIGKRKHKKVSEDINSKLFKESILNDMPCETKIENHSFKYFMNEGKWYMSVDNCLVKTHNKSVMMETFDQIVDELPVTTSLLEDYSCYEMELLMEEEVDTTVSPESTDSSLTSNPDNIENTSSVSLDNPETVASIAGGELLHKAKEEEKNELPKTSEEIAKEELHNQEVLGAENQEGTIEKDGKSEDIKINKTIDINGEKNAATIYTDKEGKQQVALTKDINLKKV